MKIVSGLIMIIGWLVTTFLFVSADSAPQQAAAVVPAVAAYVLARALENFEGRSAKNQALFEHEVQKAHENFKLNNPPVKQVEQVEQIKPWTCSHCSRINEVNPSVCEKCGKSKN